jgi:pimeloyl-ACP methyl ester carboxylesterase
VFCCLSAATATAAAAAAAAAAAEPPLWEALRALQLPVLIIHGAKDKLVPLSNSRRLAASMPTASLLELPDSGHCPHEESPKEVCRAICDWVADLGLLAGPRD